MVLWHGSALHPYLMLPSLDTQKIDGLYMFFLFQGNFFRCHVRSEQMQLWKFFLVRLNLEKNTFTFWRCNLNQPTPVFLKTLKNTTRVSVKQKAMWAFFRSSAGFPGAYRFPLVTSTRQGNQTNAAWRRRRIMGKKTFLRYLGNHQFGVRGFDLMTWFTLMTHGCHGEKCEKIETPTILLMKTIIFDNGTNEI